MTEITEEQRIILFDQYPEAIWIAARSGWAAVYISEDEIAWHRFDAGSLGDREPGPKEWDEKVRDFVKPHEEAMRKIHTDWAALNSESG